MNFISLYFLNMINNFLKIKAYVKDIIVILKIYLYIYFKNILHILITKIYYNKINYTRIKLNILFTIFKTKSNLIILLSKLFFFINK